MEFPFQKLLAFTLVFLLFIQEVGRCALDSKTTAPEFDPTIQWTGIEKTPNLQGLTGTTILIYFWSSSNFESINSLKFLKQLQDVFESHTFRIITFHVPQYEFEKSPVAVGEIMEHFDVHLPTGLDNERRIMSLYQVFKIPTFFLVDGRGRIRKKFFDDYDHSSLYQYALRLLQENPDVSIQSTSDINTDFRATPSMFKDIPMGFERQSNFGNLVKIRAGHIQALDYPAGIREDQFYLKGNWSFSNDHVKSQDRDTGLKILTSARSLSILIDPLENKNTKVYLRASGSALPQDAAGCDIVFQNGESFAIVDSRRMVHFLSHKSPPAGSLTYEFRFESPVLLYQMSLSEAPFMLEPPKSENSEEDQDVEFENIPEEENSEPEGGEEAVTVENSIS